MFLIRWLWRVALIGALVVFLHSGGWPVAVFWSLVGGFALVKSWPAFWVYGKKIWNAGNVPAGRLLVRAGGKYRGDVL